MQGTGIFKKNPFQQQGVSLSEIDHDFSSEQGDEKAVIDPDDHDKNHPERPERLAIVGIGAEGGREKLSHADDENGRNQGNRQQAAEVEFDGQERMIENDHAEHGHGEGDKDIECGNKAATPEGLMVKGSFSGDQA